MVVFLRFTLLIMLVVSGWLAVGVQAQAAGPALQVDEIDASAFPTVDVRFSLRGTSPSGGPPAVTITEDGVPVDVLAVRQGEALPRNVTFIVDLGRYAGSSVLPADVLRDTLRVWANSYFRDGVDVVSIVAAGGNGYTDPITLLLEPTQSLADFNVAVTGLDPTAGGAPQILAVARDVLEAQAASGATALGGNAVVVISRIVDTIGSRQSVPLAESLGARAAALGVQLHIIHTDPAGQYAEPFVALASAAGGQLARINRGTDLQETLAPVYDAVASSGASYVASFRSTTGTSAERTVTLNVGGESASLTYQVALTVPTVTLTAPEEGFVLVRTGDTTAGIAPGFDLDRTTVGFDVAWPDAAPRPLAAAELLVNGEAVTRLDTPLPLSTSTGEDEAAGVVEHYALDWDLTGFTEEGARSATVQVRVTDLLGVTATSAIVTGQVQVTVPVVTPDVVIVTPGNNATIERVAALASNGDIVGYGVDAVPIRAELVWPGSATSDVAAADILVDGVVAASYPYPVVTVLEPDSPRTGNDAEGVRAALELSWDVRQITQAGPNLHDVQVQVRDANGRSAVSAAITLNVEVFVPQPDPPRVVLLSPAANTTISRVALPGVGDALAFQDDGGVDVLAAVTWPDDAPRTLAVAELIYDGVPLGPESFPTLLSAADLNLRDSGMSPGSRFFRLTWDIRAVRNPGPNLGQLQLRIRDVDGFEAVSGSVPVNIQVEVASPPTVTVLSPLNNTSITRSGRYDGGSSPSFVLEQVEVSAAVDWSAQLPFGLTGAEVLANGQVVATLPPQFVDAARPGTVDLADGRRRLTLSLPWSLRDLTTAGSNLYQLQVRVVGEAGISAVSAPVNVNIQVDVPPPMPPLVNLNAPANGDTVAAGDSVKVVADVLWPENQSRPLQLVELSVDGLVKQSLLYPSGTRFQLVWDVGANATPGAHHLSVRVRDSAGVEAISPSVAVEVSPPQSVPAPVTDVQPTVTPLAAAVSTVPSVALAAPTCPDSLLAGWDDLECLRARALWYAPWVGVAALALLVWRRSRRIGPGGRVRTLVGVVRTRRPIARLYVVSGPDHLVGQDVNIYTNVTTLGRDRRLTDIQFYGPDDASSVSGQHCTIRHVSGRFSLMDDNSTNGTRLNGRYVDEPTLLHDGDEITLGIPDRLGVVLRFHSQMVDVKAQAARVAEPPVPVVEVRRDVTASVPTAALVRGTRVSRTSSNDVMDSILTDLGDAADRPFRLDVAPKKDAADKDG